jgi:Transposase
MSDVRRMGAPIHKRADAPLCIPLPAISSPRAKVRIGLEKEFCILCDYIDSTRRKFRNTLSRWDRPNGLTVIRHGKDLRRKVVNFVRQGGSLSQAAKLFQVSAPTVFRWCAEKPVSVTLIQQGSLEDARKALRLTQGAMASSFGFSVSKWVHYELGTQKAPAYILMDVSFLLAVAESPGREIVEKLVSQALTSTSCGSG